MSDRGDTTRILLDRYGETYAEALDIDVRRNDAEALFELLTAAILMSARISSRIAVAAARSLLRDRGLTTARAMADATRQERVDALNAGGYARYQERTSTMLGDTAEFLLERYDGDLRQLRDAADREPERERDLLEEVKGLGDVGVDIFFREAQAAWDELRPFADDRALSAADELDLGTSVDDLVGLVGDGSEFVRLIAALTRVEVGDLYDEVRAGGPGAGADAAALERLTKDDLYEIAQQEDLEGRSQMSKDELVDALSG